MTVQDLKRWISHDATRMMNFLRHDLASGIPTGHVCQAKERGRLHIIKSVTTDVLGISVSPFLKTNTFVFIVLTFAIISAGGCIGENNDGTDPETTVSAHTSLPDKYGKYPHVDRILVDLALAENPVGFARSAGHLAETLGDFSFDKQIVFYESRVLILVYLTNNDTPFPDGYDVIDFGRSGNAVSIWILPDQIFKLSKESNVTEIALPKVDILDTTSEPADSSISYNFKGPGSGLALPSTSDESGEDGTVDPFLLDLVSAEDPVEFARNTGHLAETPEELSPNKPIIFHEGRTVVSVHLKNADTSIPQHYDAIEFSRVHNVAEVWIRPGQILKLSKEPMVTEISLPGAGAPEDVSLEYVEPEVGGTDE